MRSGCSLKTEANLDCVRQLPLDKMMIESDCPWCEASPASPTLAFGARIFQPILMILCPQIRPSHASHPLLSTLATSETHSHLHPLYCPPSTKKEKFAVGKAVRGRNEPCSTGQVAWVISRLKEVTVETVAEVTTRNAVHLFGERMASA